MTKTINNLLKQVSALKDMWVSNLSMQRKSLITCNKIYILRNVYLYIYSAYFCFVFPLSAVFCFSLHHCRCQWKLHIIYFYILSLVHLKTVFSMWWHRENTYNCLSLVCKTSISTLSRNCNILIFIVLKKLQ